MLGLISKHSRGKMNFCKKCFPVPELNITNEMIRIIRMRILIPKLNLYPEFLSPFCFFLTDDLWRMPVKIIFSDFFFFLVDIYWFKNSWHVNKNKKFNSIYLFSFRECNKMNFGVKIRFFFEKCIGTVYH